MYTELKTLSEKNLATLEDLSTEVAYTDRQRRLGANGVEKLSVYTYSKWDTWSRIQRHAYQNCFESELIDQSIVGWFLKFPARTGFLDLMNYWVDTPVAGIITAYALDRDQFIWINNEKITVAHSKGVEFSLRNLHEVKPAVNEQKWACLMTLRPYLSSPVNTQ